MCKLHYIVLILLLMLIAKEIKAQLPSNDSAWVLQSALSDEFSGTSIDTTKWSVTNNTNLNWAPFQVPCLKSNVTVGSGTLKLKADSVNHVISGKTFKYSGSCIGTIYWSYRYGYIEISAKYPVGKYCYWPAFWIWGSPLNCIPSWYEEVDICENAHNDALDGHTMATDIHFGDAFFPCENRTQLYAHIQNRPRLDSIFHKYAIKWDTTSVNWYFDDNLVRSIYDATGNGIPQHSIGTLLNFNVDTSYANHHYLGGWPANFEIEYFHYYKLKTGYCGSTLTICSPISYNRATYQTITTGGGGCGTAPTFNPSTSAGSYTLRATDNVTIDVGTVIDPSGTGYFAIEIVPCPK